MVGPDRSNQSHHHQGRQIRDANVQSGFAFAVSAESESAASECAAAAAAAFPARNVGAGATLPEAGADTVPTAHVSAGQANSSRPDPSARRDPAKSNSGADAERATSDRLGGIRRGLL